MGLDGFTSFGPFVLIVFFVAVGFFLDRFHKLRARRLAEVDAWLKAVVERFVAGDEDEARAVIREGKADVVRRLANVARKAGAHVLAAGALLRYARMEPDDLEAAASAGALLLALGQAKEAAAVTGDALRRCAALAEQGTAWSLRYTEAHARVLEDIYQQAAGEAWSDERAVDASAAAGFLDGREGINYKLVGYSILVRSDRKPRRLAPPTQAELREAGERGRRELPDRPEGLEDLGLHRLREMDFDGAEAAFREAIQLDADAWPAYVGLGAALEAGQLRLDERLGPALRRAPEVAGLDGIVPAWNALTDHERRLLRLCVAPLAWAVPRIAAEGGRIHIVSLEARVTDVPAFAGGRGHVSDWPDDRRTTDALGGMAVDAHSATRIEELYCLDPASGWTLAHEFAHQAYHVGDERLHLACRALRKKFFKVGYIATDYGLKNEHEFFACAYERFVMRLALPDHAFDEVHDADREHGLDAWLRGLTAGGAPVSR